jgi:dUTP pyrophosphatase|tara:strand:+ start:149 stop:751 length:603 start_codon:yes stop_codon:yes gene_type:complete
MENNDNLYDLVKKFQDMTSEVTNTTDPELDDYMKDLEKIYNVKPEVDSKVELNVTTKFINVSNNPDPTYAKVADSGFDLRAFIEEPITLGPLERALIPTGLSFELPENTELQVRPRSGMAFKHGISCLNSPGTVDEGYRGDVGIIAVNLSNEEYTIQPGDRIAQAVIMPVVGQRISNLKKVEKLSETERGDSGYGSSGKN